MVCCHADSKGDGYETKETQVPEHSVEGPAEKDSESATSQHPAGIVCQDSEYARKDTHVEYPDICRKEKDRHAVEML